MWVKRVAWGHISTASSLWGQMMTNTVEPLRRVRDDGELATLVRRWMAAGTRKQDRVRHESVLQVLPQASAAEAAAVDGPADDETAPSSHIRPLPRRHAGSDPERVTRAALLVDASRLSADVATGLFARLAERSTVSVCRAYADWNRSDVGEWVGSMPREGLHSFHHFADDDDQALVAMAIDAVDIARDAAVDEVVIAGDLTSSLPLVHRLHAAGVRVVVAGAAHTPHDVRAACDEFIDTSSIEADARTPAGRHRA